MYNQSPRTVVSGVVYDPVAYWKSQIAHVIGQIADKMASSVKFIAILPTTDIRVDQVSITQIMKVTGPASIQATPSVPPSKFPRIPIAPPKAD